MPEKKFSQKKQLFRIIFALTCSLAAMIIVMHVGFTHIKQAQYIKNKIKITKACDISCLDPFPDCWLTHGYDSGKLTRDILRYLIEKEILFNPNDIDLKSLKEMEILSAEIEGVGVTFSNIDDVQQAIIKNIPETVLTIEQKQSINYEALSSGGAAKTYNDLKYNPLVLLIELLAELENNKHIGQEKVQSLLASAIIKK